MTDQRIHEGPTIMLQGDAAREHTPAAIPVEVGPGIACSCGVAIYGPTPESVGVMWRAHVMTVVETPA